MAVPAVKVKKMMNLHRLLYARHFVKEIWSCSYARLRYLGRRAVDLLGPKLCKPNVLRYLFFLIASEAFADAGKNCWRVQAIVVHVRACRVLV